MAGRTTSGDAQADRAGNLLRLASLGYGTGVVVVGAALLFGPVRPAWRLAALDQEALAGGLAACLLGAALLALAALAACAPRSAPAATADDADLEPWVRRTIGLIDRLRASCLVPLLLAAGAGLAALLLRPHGPIEGAEPADAYLLAGLAVLLTFPALVAERAAAALRPDRFAPAPALHRMLRLPVFAFLLAGGIEALRGAGLAWTRPAVWIVLAVVGAVAVELALRLLAGAILPPRFAPALPVDSALARLLTGATSPARQVRDTFGIDFSRSWALRFLRSAMVPALLLTVLFCWGLSGVSLIGLDERGVYERLGAPVKVFGPGLHVGLPWPLGRVRRVAFGQIHETSVGQDGPAAVEQSLPAAETGRTETGRTETGRTETGRTETGGTETGGTEGAAPASADRLWDRRHPSETDYLIASTGGQAQTARAQDFQTLSADVRVLWRVGLSDGDAIRSLYGAAEPDVLVRQAAGRLMARMFASRTLDRALGERREALAAQLRDTLAADLGHADAGIEVLAVVVEAIHPPVGAAAAYHAVQAAQVAAETSISVERGWARGAASKARRQARDVTDSAAATAAETEQAAVGDVTRFAADRTADAAGGAAFVLERYLEDVTGALSRAQITVIDSRLDAAGGPIVDLRAPAAAAGTTGLIRQH